jgi:hypothetical protein
MGLNPLFWGLGFSGFRVVRFRVFFRVLRGFKGVGQGRGGEVNLAIQESRIPKKIS